MTSKTAYQYAVLRYIHDPLTQEFMNIGVVIYAREARFLSILINDKYRRLSTAFQQFNGAFYRTTVAAINQKVSSIQEEWRKNNWLEQPPENISEVLEHILPYDDSSLVFSAIGGGLTNNLDEQLDYLYTRFVTRYSEKGEAQSRDDAQVWKVYQRELERKQILDQLSPIRIVAPTFEIDFDHAWKNEKWHPIEAISFDLELATSIDNKAHRWIGHALALKESDELGKIYFLLGSPQRPELRRAYENAIEGMRRLLKDNVVIVREEEAQEFSERLAHEISEHATPVI